MPAHCSGARSASRPVSASSTGCSASSPCSARPRRTTVPRAEASAAQRSGSAVLPTPGSPLTMTTRAPARDGSSAASNARVCGATDRRGPRGSASAASVFLVAPGAGSAAAGAGPPAAAPRAAPWCPGRGPRRAPRRAAHGSWRTRPAPTPVARRPRARASRCAVRPRRRGRCAAPRSRSRGVAHLPGGECRGGRHPAYLGHRSVGGRPGLGRPFGVRLVGQQRPAHQCERGLGGGARADGVAGSDRRPASRARTASSSRSHQSATSA